MGTKIYRESYLPGYKFDPVRNIDEMPTNSNWQVFYGNKPIESGQVLHETVTNLHSGYEKDALKQMMLTHEAAFKHQVSELHRLYKVQKDVMNEIKRKELYKRQIPIGTRPSSSSLVYPVPYEDALLRWHKSPFPVVDSNDCEVLNSRPSKTRKRFFNLDLSADNYIDVEEEKAIPDNMISDSLRNACTRNNKADLDIGVKVESKVQFFDLNKPCLDDDLEATAITSLQKNDNGKEHIFNMAVASHTKPRLLTPVLQDDSPMHKQLIHSQSSEVGHNTFQYKHDLHIRYASEPSTVKGFSNNNIPIHIPTQIDLNSSNIGNSTTFSKLLCDEILKAKGQCNYKGINSRGDSQSSRGHENFQILDNPCIPDIENKLRMFDVNSVCEVAAKLADRENEKRTADFGGHIDLNLCASENEITMVPSFASTSLDEDTSSLDKAEDPCDEVHMSAAMAILSISSFVNIDQSEENTRDPSDGSSGDVLLWFSRIASLHSETPKSNLENARDEIDEFEAMTLSLTELKEEEYMPIPLVFETLEMETEIITLPNRARRGKARGGRQKKDFQRDILPGMTSLSRHEIAEDVQTFNGIMKAMGHSWPLLAKRNGRGRKGKQQLVSKVAPLMEPIQNNGPHNEHIISVEIGLEKRVLTGWGKTPRRPRRRRCQASNLSTTALS